MSEKNSLLILTAFFFVAWLPASLGKARSLGRKYLLSNRDETDLSKLPLWAQRSNRAYENLKNYYPIFAVTILILMMQGQSDETTRAAAATFVGARFLHFAFYTLGSPVGRAGAWTISMLANAYLLCRAF